MSSPICAAASLPNSRAVRMVAWSAAACGTALLLFAGGAASAAPDPSCLSGLRRPLCPDLRPSRLKATVIEDGRRLQITGEVANEGTADAEQSTMQVTIGKVALPPEPLPAVTLKDPVSLTLTVAANGLSTTATVPALAEGASSPVKATLAVPERARVGPVTVTLTVDQADVLTEADETNNDLTPEPVKIEIGR